MTVFADRVGDLLGSGEVSWDRDDALLYAVAVGSHEEAELTLTTENSEGVRQQVLPTFAVVLGYRARTGGLGGIGDFPLSSVVHVGQQVRLTGPLPVAGHARAVRRLSAVYDAGAHALVETTTALRDWESDELLAELDSTILVRGEGGFGGLPPAPTRAEEPERDPDHVRIETTSPQQALLYRLTGDRNPLHSDPVAARRAGFPAPILHGLCTFGFAARAVVRLCTGSERIDVTRLGEISARFSSPVLPGDTLRTELWADEDRVRFRMRVDERMVLSHGRALLV